MPLTGIINVDEVTRTATLEFTDDQGLFVTEFTFLANRVSAPARSQATQFSRSDFEGGLALHASFVQLVRQRLAPPRELEGTFQYTFEKNAPAGNLELRANLGGTDIKLEWKQATNEIEFSPRLALDLAWADYLLYLRLHRDLLRQVRNF